MWSTKGGWEVVGHGLAGHEVGGARGRRAVTSCMSVVFFDVTWYVVGVKKVGVAWMWRS